ncbi:ATP-binding region ATPase domain protein [Streptomyces azureus]|nr:ATP-binding region ATPase domain protein [Streptomyces azureus]
MGDEGEDVGAVAVKAMGWAHSFPMSEGVRAGREWTRRRLESLPWAAAEPNTVDTIVLAVSELITNAHIHAHSDAHLVLTWDGDCLHVSVHDEDPTLPRQREPQPGEVSGRGVAIVRKLADEWGMRCQRHGKTVTACFRPADTDASTDRHGGNSG